MYVQTAFVNNIILEGYLVGQPTYRKAVNGINYVIFTLANKVKQETLPKDGSPSILRNDNFVMCIAFDRICSMFLYSVKPGAFLRIEGTLRSNSAKYYVHIGRVLGIANRDKENEKRKVRESMNQIIISGRLIAEPTLKVGIDGKKSVCSFVLANSLWASGQTKTSFFNCVAFGATADFIGTHYKKGNPLYVIGQIVEESYLAKDGTNKKITKVYVQTAEAMYLDYKKVSDAQLDNPRPTEEIKNDNYDISGDDLPF